MKRDKDLLRGILLKIEAGALPHEPYELIVSDFCGFDSDTISAHVKLLIQDGLLSHPEFDPTVEYEEDSVVSGEMTSKGYEYLDKVRDPEVWKKTKEIASKAGGGGLEILGQIATGVLTAAATAALAIKG